MYPNIGINTKLLKIITKHREDNDFHEVPMILKSKTFVFKLLF